MNLLYRAGANREDTSGAGKLNVVWVGEQSLVNTDSPRAWRWRFTGFSVDPAAMPKRCDSPSSTLHALCNRSFKILCL
jgi:hypothetical protein